jgi:hypothetical protein
VTRTYSLGLFPLVGQIINSKNNSGLPPTAKLNLDMVFDDLPIYFIIECWASMQDCDAVVSKW